MNGFFNPKNVVIIGASAKEGKIGYEILKNILKSKVKVYPVNPNRKEIMGIKCYKSIGEIEESIDIAIIAIDAPLVINAIEECGRKGIKRVVIISGGFKEVGNKELEKKLVEKAKKYGIRIIGPNCIGVFNGKNRFNTFFQRNMDLPPFGNVSILTQSGTFGIGLLEKFANEGIGISKFVSYGNKSDINEVDLIKYLEEDRDTKIIAIYAEDFDKKFFEKEYKKIIVILKAGRSEIGKKAASLHTGAMATNYEIFKGVCKQRKIIFADDFDEFFGILKILSMQGLPKNGNIAIITNGAGPAVLACDFIEGRKYLKLWDVPIDLTGSATGEDFINAISSLNDNIGIVILIFVFQDAPLATSLNQFYENFKKDDRIYVAVAIGGKFVMKQKKEFIKLKIPLFEEPSTLINALDKIVWFKNENSSN